MELINAYFDRLLFTKVDQKEGFTIYAAAIASSYGDGKKTYALAFVPVHMAILSKGYLKDFHWQNFQLRSLSNGWKLAPQRWDTRQMKGLETPMFRIVDRNETRTKYICETAPLEMLLLHDPKKKSNYQYGDRINLVAALITFRCVLNFVEGHERQATQPMIQQPYLNSIGQPMRSDQRQKLDISSLPISSLAVRMPKKQEEYSPSSLPSDTSYVPRNEGTKYAANGPNTSGYEFGGTAISGSSNYTKLSLNFSMPDARREEEYEEGDVDPSFELL